MRLTTILAGAAALAMSLAGVAPAFAVCPVCNTSVRLDAALAGCFVERSDTALKQLSDSGQPAVVIDLGDCHGRGSLPTGNAVGASPLELDVKFITDADGIKCLGDQIAAADDTALDPSHLFDLIKGCPAQ
jgi:hypothetical protein